MAESGNENWQRAAALGDIAEGETLGVMVEGVPLGLYNVGGTIYATHNICTHEFAIMSDGYLEDKVIECPLHAGCFDIETGKALSGPVDVDLKPYAVKVEGDEIFVDVPAEDAK